MIGSDEFGCEAYPVLMTADRAGLTVLPDEHVPARSPDNVFTPDFRTKRAGHA
jgi:hypothetical protein